MIPVSDRETAATVAGSQFISLADADARGTDGCLAPSANERRLEARSPPSGASRTAHRRCQAMGE